MSKRSVGALNGNWSGGDRGDKRPRGANILDEIAMGQTKYFLEQEQEWMEKCAEVEGVDAFAAWYDDENNIPGGKTQASARALLIKAHYETLKETHKDAFYWLKVEEQEASNCMDIEGKESFREWWNDESSNATLRKATPKERVELIRARITNFLTNDGTTQVQARVREIQNALATGQAVNHAELTNELASLVNHIQSVGAPVENGE